MSTISHIKTTVAKNQKQVDEGIQALMSNSSNRKRLIGIDTFQVRTAAIKISIPVLQLCDGNQCLIVRLASFYQLPESLYNFLSLPSFTFVGFQIKEAMAILRQDYGFVCKNILEAGPSDFKSRSSQTPSALGVLRNMHVPSSNCIAQTWDATYNLTEDLIKIAVANAYAAFCIGDKILL